MGEKIAFIAHSYHQKTHSYDFIYDYLKNFYEIDLIFDELWDTGVEIDWKSLDKSYEAIVFFQMFPSSEKFKLISNKNIVYLPMYDHVVKWNFSDWLLCKNVKMLNFSQKLHNKLIKYGFNSTLVKYFVEPKEFCPGNPDEVFFWQRQTKLNIDTVRKMLGGSNYKIHIHKAMDPGHEFKQPRKEDEEKYHISYSEWFETKEQFDNCLKSKGIYISPRMLEGIGMSFLEAMAMGKLVIANNQITMNEYIKNGETGYLCNFKFPKNLKLKNIEQIQKNTYEYAKNGYQNWLKQRESILELIESAPIENELKLWTKIFRPFLLFDIRKIIQFKLGSNPSLKIFGLNVIKTNN